jgi:hypothetical protein
MSVFTSNIRTIASIVTTSIATPSVAPSTGHKARKQTASPSDELRNDVEGGLVYTKPVTWNFLDAPGISTTSGTGHLDALKPVTAKNVLLCELMCFGAGTVANLQALVDASTSAETRLNTLINALAQVQASPRLSSKQPAVCRDACMSRKTLTYMCLYRAGPTV